jgi:ADP-ribose pyrophosphatase
MSSTALQPWKSIGRRLLLSAPPWLDVFQEAVELPSGRKIDDFYRVVMPEFIVAVTLTADDHFVLVKGYKHGLGQVTLSPPAGVIEPGEEPLAAAKRELREETGFTADQWEFLGRHTVDGNRQCGTMHTFLARDARRSGCADENDAEELQVVVYTRCQVIRAMKAGEFGTLAGAGGLALALALGPC